MCQYYSFVYLKCQTFKPHHDLLSCMSDSFISRLWSASCDHVSANQWSSSLLDTQQILMVRKETRPTVDLWQGGDVWSQLPCHWHCWSVRHQTYSSEPSRWTASTAYRHRGMENNHSDCHTNILIYAHRYTDTTHIHMFNGLFSRTTWVSQQQKCKPFWILLKQEMMGWQWHQLDHTQIIFTTFQTDNHASTSSLNFLRAGCSSLCPTNSVKAQTQDISKLQVLLVLSFILLMDISATVQLPYTFRWHNQHPTYPSSLTVAGWRSLSTAAHLL